MGPGGGGSVGIGGGFSVGVGGGASGGSFNPGPTESVTMFPEEAIQGTLIEVSPGNVSFMGAFLLSEPWMPGVGGDADAPQLHYARLMQGQGIGTSYYLGSERQSDRSDAALLEFLLYARKRLADKGWAQILDDFASASSALVAAGMASVSGLALTCNKPFVFDRDCSYWSGPKRRIKVRGLEVNVAGSADGRTVAAMYTLSTQSRIPTAVYDAVATELRSHGIEVRKVTAVSSLGQTLGYILELDGDGYSILEDLSK